MHSLDIGGFNAVSIAKWANVNVLLQESFWKLRGLSRMGFQVMSQLVHTLS